MKLMVNQKPTGFQHIHVGLTIETAEELDDLIKDLGKGITNMTLCLYKELRDLRDGTTYARSNKRCQNYQ